MEGIRQLRTALDLLDNATNAWCEIGSEDEMAQAYLRDEVMVFLDAKPWSRKARRRLRYALEVAHRTDGGAWMNAVPMLANMPRPGVSA